MLCIRGERLWVMSLLTLADARRHGFANTALVRVETSQGRGMPGYVRLARLTHGHRRPDWSRRAIRYPRLFGPRWAQRICLGSPQVGEDARLLFQLEAHDDPKPS